MLSCSLIQEAAKACGEYSCFLINCQRRCRLQKRILTKTNDIKLIKSRNFVETYENCYWVNARSQNETFHDKIMHSLIFSVYHPNGCLFAERNAPQRERWVALKWIILCKPNLNTVNRRGKFVVSFFFNGLLTAKCFLRL